MPETLDDLTKALTGGLLVEGPHLDFKKEPGPPKPSSNVELAKDLAGFAVDGGRVFIGVDESDDGPPCVVPVPLDGLKERVDQIARTRVDPPLTVRCIELGSEDDQSGGVLVVVVPPSPDAPHQVDGRFRGRGDTTNRVLSAVEVRAVHQQRQRRLTDTEVLLDREIDRDPTPPELRELGHLFVVAQPDALDDELFYTNLEQDFSTWWFHEVLPRLSLALGTPSTKSVGEVHRRAQGWAVHDSRITAERTVQGGGDHRVGERDLLDLEVNEDGGIRGFTASATDLRRDGRLVLLDEVVVGLVLNVVEIAREIAAMTGFYGSWRFGVALTNIRGSASESASMNLLANPPGYSEDHYQRTAAATFEELDTDLPVVVERLVAPLMRGLTSPVDLRKPRT